MIQRVRGAGCGVRRAVLGAACWVLGAVLGAECGVLSAECGVQSAVAAQSAAEQQPLPDGDGVAVVRSRCLVCHGADLIVSQRLTESGWSREVDKMARWGAGVSDAERPALVAYLSRHFAPAPIASHAPASEGEAAFKRACLACHGADMIEAQRLSPAGWTREVEKMMRWGAPVSETEKAALVEYLAARHPAP